MMLSVSGAMRISRTEALDIIKEKKSLTDINIVMEVDSRPQRGTHVLQGTATPSLDKAPTASTR
eukprot:12103925-Heterocapsa_arctica.AAC.1